MSVSLVKTPDFIDYPSADIAEMESELWDARQWVLDVSEQFGEDSPSTPVLSKCATTHELCCAACSSGSRSLKNCYSWRVPNGCNWVRFPAGTRTVT